LVPEKFSALWRQRLRWAQGGYEAAAKFGRDIFRWKNRRMWIVSLEYWVSVLWCYALVFSVLCWAATNTLPKEYWPEVLSVPTMLPGWTGVILATMCLLQFTVGLIIDRRYERRGLIKHTFWAIWYPAGYWFLSAATTVVAVPKGMLARRKQARHARWISPKRTMLTMPQWIRGGRKETEQRSFFWKALPKPEKMFEAAVMFVSWGLWAYLITPLLSLVLWYAGVALFADRIISPASLEVVSNVYGYGVAIVTMWLCLALWITWNQKRYGRRNRRSGGPSAITPEQSGAFFGLSRYQVEQLRLQRQVALHLDEHDHPVIETIMREENVYPIAAASGG